MPKAKVKQAKLPNASIDDKDVQTSFYLPPGLHIRLKTASAQLRTPMNKLVVPLIEKFLKEQRF
jgi:hypothetical protein